MNPSPRVRRNAHEQGIALVLTLAILALVTLLVIGFLTSARVENMAARNFNDNLRARQLARAAMDEAVTVLRTSTPIVDSSHFYVTRPGQAGLKQSGGSYTNQLYSYPASGTPQTVNLNEYKGYEYIQLTPALRFVGTGPTNLNWYYLNNTGDVYVPWVYIGTNGQEVTYGSGQPIVGRYVWYVDDEACKINLNAAYKTDTNADLTGPVTPAQVDIRGLFNMIQWTNGTAVASTVLDRIRAYALSPGFTTRSEWQVPVNGPISNTTYGGFYYVDFVPTELTIWGSDPTITPWGADRLNLNTVGTGAVAVAAIANMLGSAQLAGWFGVGKTFATKYPSVQQIAANIVDFIDTDNNIPTDLTTNLVNAAWNDVDPPGCLGLERTPYLNEFWLSNQVTIATQIVPPTPPDTVIKTNRLINMTMNTLVELCNMYPSTWVNPGNSEVYILTRPSITFEPTNNIVTPANFWSLPSNVSLPVPGDFTNNQYSVVTNIVSSPQFTVTGFPTRIVLNSGIITAIFRNPNGRIDYAAIPVQSRTTTVTSATAPPDGTVILKAGSACNDPRVKPVSINWNALNSVQDGTLGAYNNGTKDYSVTWTNGGQPIVSDGDPSSHITPNRDNGTLYSVGELGYIHTGVPWRTLRLQPIPAAETNTIPDWAVLDLFSTVSGSVTGRVNLNSKHAAQTVGPTVGHNRALRGALFAYTNAFMTGSTTNSYYPVVASNIVERVFSKPYWTNSTPYTSSFVPGMYNWIGEACEVKGMTDYAENSSGITTNDAWAEMRIRRLANLVTTRSTAFKVIVVAQTIVDANRDGQYNSADGDIISGEEKLMAVVERYEQSGVGFRIKHFKPISD